MAVAGGVDLTVRILTGDCRDVMKTLPDESVHCVVTSPPYWGLRDYGTGKVGIGLEPTLPEHIAALAVVFQEVKRVLRKDGTLWLNYGDAYAGSWGAQSREHAGKHAPNISALSANQVKAATIRDSGTGSLARTPGLKPKDLMGLPWRIAFALQADGWTLRSDIIWSKPNPMPESVTDRPTKAHEYLFMFCKAEWRGPLPRQFGSISSEDSRWLALFLDTEGNITVKRAATSKGSTNYGTQICFASTQRGLLNRAREIIGRGAILEREGHNAPMFYLQLSNIQAADLLYQVYPHLIVKQRQARLGIFLQDVLSDADQERRTKEGRLRGRGRAEAYTAVLERLWATNKLLNHFGEPDISWIPEPEFGSYDKSARYWYDADAIRTPLTPKTLTTFGTVRQQLGNDALGGVKADNYSRDVPIRKPKVKVPGGCDRGEGAHGTIHRAGRGAPEYQDVELAGANARSVWEIATEAFPEAHFATFPTALAERCIKAGCPQFTCPECGTGLNSAFVLELESDGNDLPPLWNGVSAPAVAQASDALLQPGMRERRAPPRNGSVPGMRAACEAGSEEQAADILQHPVREQTHSAQSGIHEGLDDHFQGVSDDLSQRSSDGDEVRVRDATSPSDGAGDRAFAFPERGGSSQERQSLGQSARELGADDQARARSARQGTAEAGADRVPALLRRNSSEQPCPHCKARLTRATLGRGVTLDPFGGAGTVGLVADRLQRNAVLIELNPEYAAMAERRIRGDAPLLAQTEGA